jgi:hypothetical protein
MQDAGFRAKGKGSARILRALAGILPGSGRSMHRGRST